MFALCKAALCLLQVFNVRSFIFACVVHIYVAHRAAPNITAEETSADGVAFTVPFPGRTLFVTG